MNALCSFVRRFLNDRDGNFAVLTALLMPTLLIGVTFALNFATITITQTELQKAADKTALDLSEFYGNNPDKSPEAIRQMALQKLADLLGVSLEDLQKTNVIVTETVINGVTYKKVEIKLSVKQPDGSLSIFAEGTETFLGTSSTAIAGIRQEGGYAAISIFFVVDQSGSMGWTAEGTSSLKIDVLKSAMKTLLTDFESRQKLALKSNIVSFSDEVYRSPPGYFPKQSDLISVRNKPLPLHNGFQHVAQYVEKLQPLGGTNLGPAVDVATRALKNEVRLSKNTLKSGLNIIILSDGANNFSSNDASTVDACKLAKSVNITVSAIFFRTNGAEYRADNERGDKVLRSCVSAPGNYVSAATPEELVKALKLIGSQTIRSKPRLIQ